MRAAWSQLQGGVGGGSTIAQQYVNNTLVSGGATLWRKYREMVVAVTIALGTPPSARPTAPRSRPSATTPPATDRRGSAGIGARMRDPGCG